MKSTATPQSVNTLENLREKFLKIVDDQAISLADYEIEKILRKHEKGEINREKFIEAKNREMDLYGEMIFAHRDYVEALIESKTRDQTMILSYYQCPSCNEEWEDTWECACNSECPKCESSDIEPYDWKRIARE